MKVCTCCMPDNSSVQLILIWNMQIGVPRMCVLKIIKLTRDWAVFTYLACVQRLACDLKNNDLVPTLPQTINSSDNFCFRAKTSLQVVQHKKHIKALAMSPPVSLLSITIIILFANLLFYMQTAFVMPYFQKFLVISDTSGT